MQRWWGEILQTDQSSARHRVIDRRGGDTNAINGTHWWGCLQEVKPFIVLSHLNWCPHRWRGEGVLMMDRTEAFKMSLNSGWILYCIAPLINAHTHTHSSSVRLLITRSLLARLGVMADRVRRQRGMCAPGGLLSHHSLGLLTSTDEYWSHRAHWRLTKRTDRETERERIRGLPVKPISLCELHDTV